MFNKRGLSLLEAVISFTLGLTLLISIVQINLGLHKLYKVGLSKNPSYLVVHKHLIKDIGYVDCAVGMNNPPYDFTINGVKYNYEDNKIYRNDKLIGNGELSVEYDGELISIKVDDFIRDYRVKGWN